MKMAEDSKKTLLEMLKESEKYKEKSGTEFDKVQYEKIFENYKQNPIIQNAINREHSISDVVSELISAQFAEYFFEKNALFDFAKADIADISELLPMENYLSKKMPPEMRREILSMTVLSSCPPIFLTVLASVYVSTPFLFPIVAAGAVVTFLTVLAIGLFNRDSLLAEHKGKQMKQLLDDAHYLDNKIKDFYKK